MLSTTAPTFIQTKVRTKKLDVTRRFLLSYLLSYCNLFHNFLIYIIKLAYTLLHLMENK